VKVITNRKVAVNNFIARDNQEKVFVTAYYDVECAIETIVRLENTTSFGIIILFLLFKCQLSEYQFSVLDQGLQTTKVKGIEE